MTISKRKLAVFDIDGTIFRSSLLIELVEGLVKEGLFPLTAKAYYMTSHQKWQDRSDGYEPFIGDVVKTYLKFIKGVRRADVLKVAEQVVEEQKQHTYKYTRDLIKKLKDSLLNGDLAFAIRSCCSVCQKIWF